jgi:hypothetical protein
VRFDFHKNNSVTFTLSRYRSLRLHGCDRRSLRFHGCEVRGLQAHYPHLRRFEPFGARRHAWRPIPRSVELRLAKGNATESFVDTIR